jgi:penicillin-binding protein 1A
MASQTHSSAHTSPLMKWGPPILKVVGTGAAVGLVTFGLLWNSLFAQMPVLPDRDSLWSMNREPAVEFIDAQGETIAVRGFRYGRAVSAKTLPKHVTDAFIAAEDKRFREHTGVDTWAIVRAFMANARAGRTVEGASTITQQLVKNLFLSPDQTIKRKAQEARLAGDLERMLSKDDILDLYLNRVYLGAGAYGVDAAAHTFFNKTPDDLTIAEAALLASLPKAPSRLSQLTQSARAKERQEYVLEQMVEAGFITQAQADEAATQPLTFAKDEDNIFTGHALDYAVERAQYLLPNPPADMVIKLSLDLRLQDAAQKAITNGIETMGKGRRASEGAAIIIDNATGAIRAMVGGVDYDKSKFNRATQARRQPGSSFKMFVYAAALEDGMTPGTVRFDMPVTIQNWRPRNYGGEYRGAVTLSEALAESLNTVAAQVGYEIGIPKVTALAREFGITSDLHNFPSITLGSDEVTLYEMTTAFGVLAKGGLKMSPYIIEEIRNSKGDLLYSNPAASAAPRIYPENLAGDMNAMLSRVVVAGTGGAARFGGWDIAGKTGTSQEWRDAWFLGYTTRYVGGVWVGNDNDTPMARITGGEMSARMWANMMEVAHEGITPEPLPGAKKAEDYLSSQDMDRLNFYRRLSSAFAAVEARGGG